MQVTVYQCRECGHQWETRYQSFECPKCEHEDIMWIGNYMEDQMETLILIGKIYATGWLFLGILLFIIMPLKTGTVATKILDKVMTVTVCVLIYSGCVLAVVTLFLKVWGLI